MPHTFESGVTLYSKEEYEKATGKLLAQSKKHEQDPVIQGPIEEDSSPEMLYVQGIGFVDPRTGKKVE